MNCNNARSNQRLGKRFFENGVMHGEPSIFSLEFALIQRKVWCFIACLFLAGCLIKRNDYEVPAYPLPEKVQIQSGSLPIEAVVTGSDPGQVSTNNIDINAWWLLFGCDELTALVQRALANNPDIRIAALHVTQAKIRDDQAHGAQYPTVDASVAAGPQHGSAPSATTSGASLTAAYDIDIWGEHAAMAQEADYQLWQAEFDADNVRRTVTASVASTYVDYIYTNDRIKIAHLTENILSGLLETLEKRAAVGDATLLELEQQRSALYSERALIPSLELQRSNAIEALAALSGTLPAELTLSDADLDSIHLPGSPPELPSSLLLRRPDVRSMESKLLASDVDIDVMRARLLPSFNLTAQAGYSGLLQQLIGPKSFFWNMFGNITTNVFDSGKLSGDVQLARLTHEEMIADYGKTLLQAVREVEIAVNTIRSSDQRIKLQQEALQSANRAWGISNKMYLIGGADFMTLQDTERTYRRYVEDNQQLRTDFYHGYINLFLALGGSQESTTINSDDVMAQIDWQPTQASSDQAFWQVELSGVYQRQTVAAVLQDLQRRYPKQMEQKKLYPQLEGRIENIKYGQASWYRLRVAKFSTFDEAQQFCSLIRNDLQRCLILSSHSSKPIVENKP